MSAPARPRLAHLGQSHCRAGHRLLWQLLLALALWCSGLGAAVAAVQLLQFRQAQATLPDANGLPNWSTVKTVSLPDDWATSFPQHSGIVWYRMTFDAEGASETGNLFGLYIERMCAAGEVYFNGRLVHIGGQLMEPVSRNCQRPQLVSLPASQLLARGNVLEIRIMGYAEREVASRQRAGGLSTIELGPYGVLSEQQARRAGFAITVPQVVCGTLVLMGGFMFVMGWFNRAQSYLAYFGALMVGWALVLSRLWLSKLPWSNAVSEALLASLMSLVAWAAVQFLMRYAGRRIRWLDIGLPSQCMLMPLTLWGAGSQRLYAVSSVWFTLLSLEIALAALFYVRETRLHRRHQLWLMGPLLAVVGVGLATEFLAQQTQLDVRVGQLGQLLPSLVFMALGLRLVQQYGRALKSAEQDRAELEKRVRDATAQIERNFAQLAELRVEQVTDRERKRIAGDLHDDLGAKLLTIVHTSDSERISTLAREALEEMRLSVRGLTGKPVRLTDALADWRAEVVSRLSQSSIEAEWSAPSDDDVPQTLSARAFVQTTRILREAVSNIIKHSGASNCSVRCTIADGDFQLLVQDNGNGIPMELDGRLDRGHGMSSMKHRAKQMQGQCLVESGPGYGTVIRLTLPLDQHVTPTDAGARMVRTPRPETP